VFEIVWERGFARGADDPAEHDAVLVRRAARPGGAIRKRTLRNEPFWRIGCMITRALDAVEASSGGERRALCYLGEVLVEEHPGDEFLARSDADLVVQALGVVLDRVR
jgi:hypothetical protein